MVVQNHLKCLVSCRSNIQAFHAQSRSSKAKNLAQFADAITNAVLGDTPKTTIPRASTEQQESHTWKSVPGKVQKGDYRDTKLYQNLVRHLFNGNVNIDKRPRASSYAHIHILGIKCLHQHTTTEERKARFGDRSFPFSCLRGCIPYDDFLLLEYLDNEETPYNPDHDDVNEVLSILNSMGMPFEVADIIMNFAEYSSTGKIKISHDPFHPLNRDQLSKYFDHCWSVLLNSQMLAQELGRNIDWRQEITKCINGLWPNEKSSQDLARPVYRRGRQCWKFVKF
ncbi:hypothetical protein N7456_012467 [Penicillium angulare]|uniref:Uncharacterized protein n=1 Tax=Penicillium angulare TaxID=116970 RepID=A0A9W9EVX6_9EURO|nr:hypothetical protein N7456_012467 [Penicillium angulare]